MAQNMNLSFIEGPLWSKLYNVQCKIINSYCVTKRIFILKFCHCASGHMSTIWVSLPVKQELFLNANSTHSLYLWEKTGGAEGWENRRGVCEVGKERREVRVLKGWEMGEIQRKYATLLNWKRARSREWKVWELEGLDSPEPPWLLVITSKVKI